MLGPGSGACVPALTVYDVDLTRRLMVVRGGSEGSRASDMTYVTYDQKHPKVPGKGAMRLLCMHRRGAESGSLAVRNFPGLTGEWPENRPSKNPAIDRRLNPETCLRVARVPGCDLTHLMPRWDGELCAQVFDRAAKRGVLPVQIGVGRFVTPACAVKGLRGEGLLSSA